MHICVHIFFSIHPCTHISDTAPPRARSSGCCPLRGRKAAFLLPFSQNTQEHNSHLQRGGSTRGTRALSRALYPNPAGFVTFQNLVKATYTVSFYQFNSKPYYLQIFQSMQVCSKKGFIQVFHKNIYIIPSQKQVLRKKKKKSPRKYCLNQ